MVKYDKNGRFLAQVGSEKAGKGLGEFNLPHGLQVDAQGNVWVADRTNNRYQVLDNNLKPMREITNLGVGWTVCISPGPHQYAFFSNSNPNGNMPGTWDNTGEIYKAELDGTVLGKFGHAGKLRARIPGGSHDGLPQSERDYRGRNRIVAGAETRSPANTTARSRPRRTMMKHLIPALLLRLDCGFRLSDAPEIKFDSVPNALQLPAGLYLGEVGGVATNSRGDIFVYTRTGHPTITIGTARPFAHGGSRLFEFDRNGKYRSRDRQGHATASCSPRRSASIRRTTSGWWMR